MRLAYIIGSYPTLTTTFIDREIQLLEKWGVDLGVFSIRRSKSKLSSVQSEIQQDVSYLLPVNYLSLVAAHILFSMTRSNTFWGTLFYLLRRPHPSVKTRLKTILHFGEGVYLAWKMRHNQYQHIHAHFADRAAIVALVASRLLDIRYSLTAHAMDIYVNPILLPEKITGAAFVATCTAYNQAHLHSLLTNGAKEKIKCIYHGLDTSLYNPTHNGHFNPTTPLILSVGQLKEKKGFTYLLQACKQLIEDGFHFQCQIVGDGPLRTSLLNQINDLGLAEVVKLCGALPHEQVIEKYSQASIFVLPAVTSLDGDRDGIPNVILEAQAMQIPVISTRHSGIPEAITDGETGQLVESMDAHSLAQAIGTLMKQPALRRQLGQNGRNAVIEKFDLSRNIGLLYQEFSIITEEN